MSGSGSNSTRGIFAGGKNPSVNNIIDYITIATLGDAADFGDLTSQRFQNCNTCFSATRGCFNGGSTTPATVNTIDYVTILSTGNATDFGDLTLAPSGSAGTCSNAHGGL